jgi:hypothetical protein
VATKCDDFEGRLEEERGKVSKAKAAMKKSVRLSVKALRDELNARQVRFEPVPSPPRCTVIGTGCNASSPVARQNLLMEAIRVEEESKLAHLAHLAAQVRPEERTLLHSRAYKSSHNSPFK